MKATRVVVLGSTGSIGRQTLDIIRANPKQFTLLGIAAYRSTELLAQQAKEFNVSLVAIGKAEEENNLLIHLGKDFTGEIYAGLPGVNLLASLSEADLVIQAMSGAVGIIPTIYALRAGKTIGLANKETMVAAGELVRQVQFAKQAKIIPIDSEHAAIAQCLEGRSQSEVKNLWLTCSGGPFLTVSAAALPDVTPEMALKHPKWDMGSKITVDSATLMNKGLEIIEAHHLFAQPYDKIKTIIHPQSIVHSMVEFIDNSMLAQLGVPDMRLPIQYALSYPKRQLSLADNLDLYRMSTLDFSLPDFERFPAIALAYSAGHTGGTLPAVMNAANEVAVYAFLRGEIRFLDIVKLTRKVMDEHKISYQNELEIILEADRWARETCRRVIMERS